MLISIIPFSVFAESVSLFAYNENDYKLIGNPRDDIVGIAKTQIGYRPSRENYSKYAYDLSSYGASNPNSWCGYFVSWCAMRAGLLGTKVKYITGVASAKKAGTYYLRSEVFSGKYTPKKGDIVIYGKTGNASGCHVGLMADNGFFTSGKFKFTNIEGNTSDDTVQSKPRCFDSSGYVWKDWYVVGFVSLPYGSESSKVTTGETPKKTTTNTNKTPSVVAKTVSVNWTQFPNQIDIGDSYPLRGTISSNYPIYYVSAMLLDGNGNSVIPSIDFAAKGTKNINIDKNHVINDKMYFDRITSAGTYKVRIIVNNNKNGSQDGIWYKDYPFTVKAEAIPAPSPTISAQTIDEGQRITLKCSDTNATIRYKINGGTEKVCSSGKSISLTSKGSYNIEAWATGSGYISSPHVRKTVSVEKVGKPSISDVNYGGNSAWVTISGNGSINYTTNGSTPTKNSIPYRGTISLDRSTTIKAMASQYGKVSSDVASKYLSVSAPDTPSNVSRHNTKDKIAQGKTATIKWDSDSRATNYIASLYFDGELIDTYETKGTKASFTLHNVGVYTMDVVAENFVDESPKSRSVTVESMAPVTVTFVDKIQRRGNVDDAVVEQIQENINSKYEKEGRENPPQIEGNIIAVQTIDYDTVPNLPNWKDKMGFSKQRFSIGEETRITEDTTVYAYYSVKSYSVEFWNYWRDYAGENGKIGDTQTVLYSFSATAPTDINVPDGYILAGWNVDNADSECYDYTFVDGNMKLYTSYTWENPDLPVELEIVSVKRENTCKAYSVELKYSPCKETDIQARIIVTLYTADGKTVDVGVKDVNLMGLDPGFFETDTMTIEYKDKISKISAVMVNIDNDKTGGAISEMKYTENIEFPTDDIYWDKWSAWSTAEPDTAPAYKDKIQGIEREIESKTQYRYRDLLTKTSSSSSMSGWDYVKKVRTSWSEKYGPVYSNPSGNGRDVTSESYVKSSNYKTIYHYYRYANSRTGGNGSTRSSDYPNYYEYTFDYELPRYTGNYGYKYQWGSGENWNTVWSVDYIGKSYTTKQWVSDNIGTRWYYRDPVYTYYYEKWDDWSDWSFSYHSGDETKSRTVYRYRDKFNAYAGYDPDNDSQLEEPTVKTYDISGNIKGLETDYQGKLATILVYKKTNSDPTQSQLQYVEQISLGENNSYSFDVNPKDELSENTGDYVVTLSIEGCDKLVNVDLIKAPVPQCTVTFQNDDGSILKYENDEDVVLTIDKGSSIDAKEIPIPTKEGHRFLEWDTSLIDINTDMTISPIYEKKSYNVVFVDHEHETAEMLEVQYGTPATLPDVEEIAGKKFLGWDIECSKFVTADEIIDIEIFNIKEDEPYYKTVDDKYILVSEYNSETHTIVDETEYYKYISENHAITESKIITAKWETLKYKVEFYDFNGNIIKEEMVAYGESAIPPAQVEEGGVTYSWDLTGSEWWNVTYDMKIYPYIPQTVQVDAPTISVPAGESFGVFEIELQSSVPNGKIYYTTDCEITEVDARKYVGNETTIESNSAAEEQTISLMSDEQIVEVATYENEELFYPELTANNMIEEYTEPINIYAGSVIYAFAVDEDGNVSPISVFQYESDYSEDRLGLASNEYVPDTTEPQIVMKTIKANAGETVTVPVSIANNMGITNLDLILGYNADNLTLESVENGDVFANSEFTYDVREDGSCKFTWETSRDNSDNGVLMNVTFTVNEDTTDTKSLLDLSVDYSADENEEEWYFVTVPGAITNEVSAGTLGDVNGDEETDFSDAILILKHDVGISSLNESQVQAADVNGDGETDFADAILILQLDVGLIDKLPTE